MLQRRGHNTLKSGPDCPYSSVLSLKLRNFFKVCLILNKMLYLFTAQKEALPALIFKIIRFSRTLFQLQPRCPSLLNSETSHKLVSVLIQCSPNSPDLPRCPRPTPFSAVPTGLHSNIYNIELLNTVQQAYELPLLQQLTDMQPLTQVMFIKVQCCFF